MHEATVTIIENTQPNPRGPHKVKVDTGTKTMKMNAWDACGLKLRVGDTFDIQWVDAEKSFEGRAYTEHTIKVANLHVGVPKSNGAAPARAADVGPHLGMWEKRTSELLVDHGMAALDIRAHIILCRQIAREGLRADIDSKAEFNDDLEDLSFDR